MEDIDLDEVIEIPPYDLEKITLDDMQILQEILKKKTRQEQLKREHKKKKVLFDIRDIFVEAFNFDDINKTEPIITQLVNIVDKVNTEDVEPNDKLFLWLERKFHKQIMVKMIESIEHHKAKLSSKDEEIKEVLNKAYTLISKLCNIGFFIDEIQWQ